MPVRIALVEDNPSVRRRYLERLRFFDDVEVVFAAESGEQCLHRLDALAPEERPAVVLMDIELPGISGIEATTRLKDAYPDVEVMMQTVFEDEEKIFSAIQAGASGYLLKDASTDHVVGAVLELLRGGAPLSPAVARKMLGYVRRRETAAPDPKEEAADAFDLTQREREILERLVDDDLEPVIAEKLHISPHTVRTHIKNIYRKLHVHSRASAVRVALSQRLTGSGEDRG